MSPMNRLTIIVVPEQDEWRWKLLDGDDEGGRVLYMGLGKTEPEMLELLIRKLKEM